MTDSQGQQGGPLISEFLENLVRVGCFLCPVLLRLPVHERRNLHWTDVMVPRPRQGMERKPI